MGTESTVRGARRDRAPRPAQSATGSALLAVRELDVRFRGSRGAEHQAVRGVDVELRPGRVLGVAGESGSGKSSLALAVMGLLPLGTSVLGSIRYDGEELVGMPEKQLRGYRGSRIAMVSQEALAALNPTLRVRQQMRLVLKAHLDLGRHALDERIAQALRDVRLTDVERVLHSYPSELSGGMCQRVVIAMALACGSRVLLADEPTTALDVTVQGEIIRLLRGLVAERDLGLLMISHDLAVLNEICDDLVVMYRGEVVEAGPIDRVLRAPAHPYTRGLLNSVPRMSNRGTELPTLPMPDPAAVTGPGCRFAGRCAWRVDACDQPQRLRALTAEEDRYARCHRAEALIGSAEETP
jgi:oligopeptide/dipeptide ABC transporter ATP-binding protein